jgi:hypothetical protein
MCEDHDPIVRLNDRRDVFLRVTLRVQKRHVRRYLKALRVPRNPQIALIDRPVIVEPRIGEQRRVDRVVGMVVGKDRVGHVARRHAERSQRVEYRWRSRHQARVDDDEEVAIPNQAHGGRDPMVGSPQVAFEEHVDTRHGSRLYRSRIDKEGVRRALSG